MAKADKKFEYWLKWIWEADQQRRELEARKILVQEGRIVSREEWEEKLGRDLFIRLNPDQNYNRDAFAALLNSEKEATTRAMRTWHQLTKSIYKWQDKVRTMYKQSNQRTEAMILISMFGAMVSGDLVKIRTCVQCGVVFSALQSTNQFHSKGCRNKFYRLIESKEPGYKEKQAAYQRARYAVEKKRLEKALLLARKK